MTIQFIASPLTHGRKVIANALLVIKVEPTDEFHNRLDGWGSLSMTSAPTTNTLWPTRRSRKALFKVTCS